MGSRARNGLLVISRVAAATVIIAALSGLTSPPASVASDEDRVRAVLNTMNSSYNHSDFGAFASHLCADIQQVPDFEAGWHVSRDADGATQIAINTVSVTGDRAVANVRFQAANRADAKTLDVGFVREGADWKVCEYHSGRTV